MHVIGHLWDLSSAKFGCLAFCVSIRLSWKFPCTGGSASPFDERVKKCMNHLRDSSLGKFSHASLSACLAKSLLSVYRIPSSFSKSLAASDLSPFARISAKALYRDLAIETGFSVQIIGNQASRQPIATPTVRFNILISEDDVHVLTHSAS